MGYLVGFVLVAAIVAIAVGLSRATELFVLEVRPHDVRVVRGRIPKRLLGDIHDVVAASRVTGRIRAVVRDGAARVEARGAISDNVMQRLRNTVSLWPVAKIKNAPRR